MNYNQNYHPNVFNQPFKFSTEPNFLKNKADETKIINSSEYIQVLFEDGSEKIFKCLSLASCELLVSRDSDSSEWNQEDKIVGKVLSIDKEIRLKPFSKVKAITHDEILLETFTSLL